MDQHSTTEQMIALKVLQGQTVPNAIGAACSYLLHCAYNEPETLRRVMNEKVVREGFAGISLLQLINRVCR